MTPDISHALVTIYACTKCGVKIFIISHTQKQADDIARSITKCERCKEPIALEVKS
jgi:DNA-directed RNA polymerase subunit RPC12/RpoP